jgi:hypothetical protein
MKRTLWLALAAAAAAVVPLPPAVVERWYSAGVYPRLQRVVTPLTNVVPFALLDLAAILLLAAGLAACVVRWRARGARRAASGLGGDLLRASAIAYLAFVAMWGLNYRRVPLEAKLAYEPGRVTREAARQFAATAIGLANAGYGAAHAALPRREALERGFAETVRALGADGPVAIGRPKRSLLQLYFRYAAIDGMTDPWFHEIVLNPDLLEAERPFVLAHEWAHLAGYADEAEANFVAWLSCLRSDGPGRYSAWLTAYQHGVSVLTRAERRALPPLGDGPRQDLRAMAERYQRSSPAVREAARQAYDSYLRANRVTEGIESYGLVLRLMLGTSFDEGWVPRRK